MEMAGVAIITAGTAHESVKLNVNTIRVLSKQHGFGTVLPPLRFNQPPRDFYNKGNRQKKKKKKNSETLLHGFRISSQRKVPFNHHVDETLLI